MRALFTLPRVAANTGLNPPPAIAESGIWNFSQISLALRFFWIGQRIWRALDLTFPKIKPTGKILRTRKVTDIWKLQIWEIWDLHGRGGGFIPSICFNPGYFYSVWEPRPSPTPSHTLQGTRNKLISRKPWTPISLDKSSCENVFFLFDFSDFIF